MKTVFLFLLVGVNFIQAADELRKTLKTKWQKHDKKQEDYRNYLAKLSPKARCLKIVSEQNGKSKYYQTKRSNASFLYVDMLQICESFLIPRESSHLVQTSKKINEHLKITGYHNIYENNGSIQVFRNMENENEIKWEDPHNFMAAMGNNIKRGFENCLCLPEHQRPNCISDELPKWRTGDIDVISFGRKILLSLLNKVNGKTITRHGIRFRYFENVGGPVEDVEVARKECCISLVLNGFAARTENETLEYMSDIVKILNEDNKLDQILVPGYYTALILAVKKNQMKVAGILLKANANVDAQDFFGKTALMHACYAYPTAENNYASETHPNLVMVEILLKNNSTLNIQDNAGITALIYATFVNGKYYLEIVNVLLRAGAKIDVQDMHGETALMWAAGNGYVEKVKILLKENAGVNIQNNQGRTALLVATEHGRIKTMKVLLKAEAEIDVQGENGFTALMVAAARGNLEAVKLLLKANANVKIIGTGDFDGTTAAGLAKDNGHDEVAEAIDQFNN